MLETKTLDYFAVASVTNIEKFHDIEKCKSMSQNFFTRVLVQGNPFKFGQIIVGKARRPLHNGAPLG